jgi:hypothetical protein
LKIGLGWYATFIDEEGASDGRSEIDDLAETGLEAVLAGHTLENETGRTMTGQATGVRGSKGAQVPENRDRFKKVGLPLAVRSENEVAMGSPLDRSTSEVPEISRRERQQLHSGQSLMGIRM